MVAISGPPDNPTVVMRRRIELAGRAIPGSVQPYHAAGSLRIPDASRLIGRCLVSSRALARKGVGGAIHELEAMDAQIVGAGLLLASGRPLPDLPAILASHALIHTAEGEMFRDALVHACEHFRIPVAKVKEREIMERSTGALGVTGEALAARLSAMGRALGPPWRQDEKFATLAAVLALAAKL